MKEIRLTWPTNAVVKVDDDIFDIYGKYAWDQLVDHGIPRFFSFDDNGQKLWLHQLAAKVYPEDTTVQFVRCKNKDYYDLRSVNLIVGRNKRNEQLPIGVIPRGTGFAGLVYVGRQRCWTEIVDTPAEASVAYNKLKISLVQNSVVDKHSQITVELQTKLSSRFNKLSKEAIFAQQQLLDLNPPGE